MLVFQHFSQVPPKLFLAELEPGWGNSFLTFASGEDVFWRDPQLFMLGRVKGYSVNKLLKPLPPSCGIDWAGWGPCLLRLSEEVSPTIIIPSLCLLSCGHQWLEVDLSSALCDKVLLRCHLSLEESSHVWIGLYHRGRTVFAQETFTCLLLLLFILELRAFLFYQPLMYPRLPYTPSFDWFSMFEPLTSSDAA